MADETKDQHDKADLGRKSYQKKKKKIKLQSQSTPNFIKEVHDKS